MQTQMAHSEQLAGSVVRASYNALSPAARLQLKIRVIDALGCAMGAQHAAPIAELRVQIDEFGGNPLCTMIGRGRTRGDSVSDTGVPEACA